MGISYQDIESRLRSCEDKIDFVMSRFQLQNPLTPFGKPQNLLELFYQTKQLELLNEAQVKQMLAKGNGEIIEGEIIEDNQCQTPNP